MHPDVPGTGSTEAFLAVRQAYDVIGHIDRRAEYDRAARIAIMDTLEGAETPLARAPSVPPGPIRGPRIADVPIAIYAVLGSILILGVYQVVAHLMTMPPLPARLAIAPNAPSVLPQTPEAERLAAYGEPPRRLAGTPNYYVIPTAGVTVLWRVDEARKALVPADRLPPFSAVQALRLFRESGLIEVKVTDTTTGFIQSGRLAPGDLNAARNAYCAYNAGPAPVNGEMFRRVGTGTGRLVLDNRTSQPVVVKLRDPYGMVVATTYLAPSGHVEVTGLPDVRYQPDFAIGELWSRACQKFAAGMRAQRFAGFHTLSALTPLAIPPDHPGELPPVDISDETFQRDQ